MQSRLFFTSLCLSLLIGCGGSDGDHPPAPDGGLLDSGTADAPTSDGGGCIPVTLGTWGIDNYDDVSVRYRAGIQPEIGGEMWNLYLEMLRYGDAEYVGTFPLSDGNDSNHGTCAHCIIAFPGARTMPAFFVSAGTLTLDADPFELHLDATLEGVRLIEVTLEGDDLHSVPVPGGRCLDVARSEVDMRFAPPGWLCNDDQYNDGARCDCECGLPDPDCDNPELPVTRCDPGQRCVARLRELGGVTSMCVSLCDRDAMQGCAAGGVCVDDFIGDICEPEASRVDRNAELGEACSAQAAFCNVDANGFANGFCDIFDRADNVCRPRCTSESDCNVAAFERCYSYIDNVGFCSPRFPAAWTCGGGEYEDGATCNCGCGTDDPDCQTPALPVAGCGTNEVCLSGGVCVAVPANDTCASAVTLTAGTTTGTTRGATDDYTHVRGAGGCIDVEEDGPDVVYSVNLTAGQTLTVVGQPMDFDLALYLIGPGAASTCTRNSTACVAGAEATSHNEAETLTHTAATAGTYYLVVDSFFSGNLGPFELMTTIN